MFKNRAKVINFAELPDAKFRSSAAIAMVLATLRAMCATVFSDAEMSEAAKLMVFDPEDRTKTGENIGRAIFTCAAETYVATFSLHGHTISYDVGKDPELFSKLLTTCYTIKDVIACNKAFDERLEKNDWFTQIVVDLAKNMGSVKGLVNMKEIVSVTHESDLAKHSGEKKTSYYDKEGKIVTTYRHDWRLPDAAGDKMVDRSWTQAPDALLGEHIKTMPLWRYYEPVRADEFGITIYKLSEEGRNNIKPSSFDRNKLLIPNAVRGLRISVHNFNSWNKTDNGVKVDRRMPKDLTTFDLCDLFYELYDSRLTHSNDEELRKNAYDFAMDEIGKLIRTVDPTISDDKVAATVNNSFVFWAIPADLNMGFKWDENGQLLNPDLEVKFDRNKFVHFKQGTELFGDLWAKYAAENESLVEINKREREAEMLSLFAANELRKQHKSTDEGNFTSAIFNDDILAAIDC